MASSRAAWLAAVVWAAASLPASAADPGGADYCYQYALAAWNPHIRLAAVTEGIQSPVGGARGTSSLDSVAELLVLHLDDAQFDKDDAKLLTGLLARTQSGRYREVMERVRATKRFAVLRDLARDYLEKTRGKTVDNYVPGTIDFAALRAQYVADALAVKPTEERARQLDSLQKGDSIDKLFALLGPPQRVTTGYFRNSETLRFRRLLLHYRGAGRAVFGLDDKDGWQFQNTVADPLAFELLMPYRERAAELGLPDDETIRMMQITSASLVARKVAIEGSFDAERVPVEFLDTAAEILAQGYRTPPDKVYEDYYEWTLRLLAKRGGPRYRPLIALVGTAIDYQNRVAKLPIEMPPGVPRDPFVPGTLDLAAKARKYPSAYPEVTYTNGRL